MNVTISKDGKVFNFIHNSGVQTSVKVEWSGSFNDDLLLPQLQDKEKVSVVISSSHGCPLSCKFCHLTENNKPYKKVEASTIALEVIDSILFVGKHHNLRDKYLKLCFMGEGEAILNMKATQEIAESIISYFHTTDIVAGFDGVDIASTLPKLSSFDFKHWNDALVSLCGGKLNAHNYQDNERTFVRLFYSLHASTEAKRQDLIGNSVPIDTALTYLSDLSDDINTVVHYMFMDGINDSDEDISNIIELFSTYLLTNTEFRVLRYNGGGYKESSRLPDILQTLKQKLACKKFKVQYSAGSDVKAACGMFI